jgi:dCTP deaminase
MYLSDRDLAWAIETGRLIVDPPPARIDATSLDLHLGRIDDAKIWDIQRFAGDMRDSGKPRPELHVGQYKIGKFGPRYLVPPPAFDEQHPQLVMRRGNEIIVRPLGFLLWPTTEKIGTPEANADVICFVDGKSTKARTGMIVHLTAPTIHSTWTGNVTLEIVNLGPFDLVFKEGDAVAQLTVARITSPPDKGVSGTSATYGQTGVHGKDG